MTPPCRPCLPCDQSLSNTPFDWTKTGGLVRGQRDAVKSLIDPHGIALRRNWGAFVAQFSWAHYLSLTVNTPCTATALLSLFRRRFVRNLERDAQRKISYFVAVEGEVAGFTHCHALIDGSRLLTVQRLQDHWPFGFSSVRRYNPKRGAASYVVKEFGRSSTPWPEWELEIRNA